MNTLSIELLVELKNNYKDRIKLCKQFRKKYSDGTEGAIINDAKIKAYRRFNWEITEILKDLKK